MNNNQIRPEWIPSAYKDKPDTQTVVEKAEAKSTLYHRKDATPKHGFKRKGIK